MRTVRDRESGLYVEASKKEADVDDYRLSIDDSSYFKDQKK